MSAPDTNGRTTTEWLIHLDTKLTAIDDKLDGKADASRVDKLEERTRHIELKQAGIAGVTTSLGLWIKSHFFSKQERTRHLLN